MSKLKSLLIQQERNYPLKLYQRNLRQVQELMKQQWQLLRESFYSFSLSFIREKTNIGVTIENALLQHLGFSLGVLPKG